ncbi:hypothetical protein [Hymenobacter sp.]|uniref:hypothetical protein n=1 Tax=Hymenobacter sp. TaxID=1898978 RepID=UPI00286D382B|nr:hypothetical protein [Hymenobacter sp.]
MGTLDVNMLNVRPILLDLQAQLQAFDVSENVYLSCSSAGSGANPTTSQRRVNALGINEEELPAILRLLGIRSLSLSARHDLRALAAFNVEIPANAASELCQWCYLRNEAVITELRALFQHCRTVAFDEWATLSGASDLWDGLLVDVIKPLGKPDLEFIFYLGDSGRKLSFQVDEALDIISDFAQHGQVTFALDEGEAIKLWMVFNGVHPDTPTAPQNYPDRKKKYFSIFRMMRITRLLIYSANEVLLLTNQQQFVLARHKVATSIELGAAARQDFIAGFSLGMLLRLDVAHCIALGLLVFGSAGERQANPTPQDLLTYINQWIEELQKPEIIHLYQ